MVHQPIPDVTEDDVRRIVRRDFPPKDFDTVMTVLRQYGGEKSQRESARVQLGILKLANGNVDELQKHIDVARVDYRDVLAPAEYPEYLKAGFQTGELPARERKRIIENDWEQYERWLRR